LDRTADPVEIPAILRRDIARQYLVALPQARTAEEPATSLEVILSCYLPDNLKYDGMN